MTAAQTDITVGTKKRCRLVAGFRMIEAHYGDGLEIPAHYHEQSNLTLVLRGGLSERAGRADHDCAAGSVVVKPAGTVHRNRLSSAGATTFIVELPRGSTEAAPVGSSLPNDRALQYGWRAEPELARSMLKLLCRWRDLEDGGGWPEAIEQELQEELLELIGIAGRVDPQPNGREPAWLGSVREYLQSAATANFSVREVAAIAGVHPVYLARAFRRWTGSTMHDYVHRLRIKQAVSRMATKAAAAEIALSLGYSDQAHFCRVFKSHMGLTPGRFRQIVRTP